MNVTFAETRARLGEDRRRLLALVAEDPGRGQFLFLNPSYQAIWLHRWSHYLFCGGHRWLARLLWHLNLWVTGADISPITEIGGGCVIKHPLCVVLIGKAGKNLTACGHVGIGGGIGRGGVDGGPGLPSLGDNVRLDFGCMILGPIRIGDNVDIGARCLVTTDVPEGAVVEAKKPKIRMPQLASEDLQHG
jgi:serine O-acetyltransferase